VAIPGRPWHFADQAAPEDHQMPTRQGEHNVEVLTELGFSPAEIEALQASGALVRHQPNGPRECHGLH